MYVELHLESNISDNKSSCERYARYLMKENNFFFSATRTDIPLEEAYQMIDNHSKGQLKNDEAKWYAPVYSLSENESKAIVKKLFGKEANDIDELNDEEKEIFKSELIKYGQNFQDVMAENFNKKEIGISTGKDLMYIGVVEFSREYKGYDNEVIKGEKKAGEKKKGFNAHIQIIQSRKANNDKKSKISPMAKAKSNNTNFGGKSGFDRNSFKKKIEEKFDTILGYNRNLKETFLYQKHKKLGNKLDMPYYIGQDKKLKVLSKEILENIDKAFSKKKREFVSKKEINLLTEEIKLVDYFFELEKKGIVKFQEKIGEDYYFVEKGKETKSKISVSERGWNDVKQYIGGQIIKAIQLYENKTWIEAVYQMRKMASKEDKIGYLQSVEVTKMTDLNRNYLVDYFLKQGISEKVIKANIKQITYKHPKTGKEVVTTGIRNISGGFHIKNKYTETYIGNNSLSVIQGNRDVLIFNNLMEYLQFLELHKAVRPKETIIILHEKSNKNQLLELLNKEKYNHIYTSIEDLELLREMLTYDEKMKTLSADGKTVEDEFNIEKIKNMIRNLKL